ncbi:MAG: hypothetical protein WCP34_01920 [Pseudomonadota bacterium]
MKIWLPGLTLLLATLAPLTHAAESDFWRDTGRACLVGGGVMGASSALVLYPAVASGATTLPATTLIVTNTLFGCGMGMAGMMLAYGTGAVYDKLFSQ